MTARCLLLVGPSQIGKDSLIRRLVGEHGFSYHLNATTRLPRGPVGDHQEYEFLSVPEFQQRILGGRFVDWDFYAGNYYGVRPMDPDRPNPVMHCGAGMSLRISSSDPAYVPIFLAPAHADLHRDRILATFGAEESTRRLEMMEEELTHRPLFEHVVAVEDYASTDVVVEQVLGIQRRLSGQT